MTVAHPAPAPDLRQLPAVNRFLESKGLGALRITEVTSFSGRNAIWAGPTSAGRQVFVKRISGEPDSAARRLRRSLNIEHVGLDVPIPRCLGWDVNRLNPDGSTTFFHTIRFPDGTWQSAWATPAGLFGPVCPKLAVTTPTFMSGPYDFQFATYCF